VVRLSLHPHRQREPLGLPLARPGGPQRPTGSEGAPRDGHDWPLGLPAQRTSRPLPAKRNW